MIDVATLRESTVLTRPGEVSPTVLLAGSEVPEWAEGMVGDHLLAAPTPAPTPAVSVPDESWTVADLRDYAKAHEVDLHGATSKADILDAITG